MVSATEGTSSTFFLRAYGSFCYDAARGNSVWFGGFEPGNVDETWTWDGREWILRNPVHSPPALSFFHMVYDPGRQVCVLAIYDETWEWDGSDWTIITIAVLPSASV